MTSSGNKGKPPSGQVLQQPNMIPPGGTDIKVHKKKSQGLHESQDIMMVNSAQSDKNQNNIRILENQYIQQKLRQHTSNSEKTDPRLSNRSMSTHNWQDFNQAHSNQEKMNLRQPPQDNSLNFVGGTNNHPQHQTFQQNRLSQDNVIISAQQSHSQSTTNHNYNKA